MQQNLTRDPSRTLRDERVTEGARAERDDISLGGAVFARVTLPEMYGGQGSARHDAARVLRVADTARVAVVRDTTLAVRTLNLRRAALEGMRLNKLSGDFTIILPISS